MNKRCSFSYRTVTLPVPADRRIVQCPECKATRELVRGRFPVHQAPAHPRNWPCWKLINGAWTWKPVEYVVQVVHSERGIEMSAERKGA